MTLEQFITSCKLIIGDRKLSSHDVLEIVENCLEEDFIDGEDLSLKLKKFKNSYNAWVEYHHGIEY